MPSTHEGGSGRDNKDWGQAEATRFLSPLGHQEHVPGGLYCKQADQTGPQTIYKSQEMPEAGPALDLVLTQPRRSLWPKRPVVLDPSLVRAKNIGVDISVVIEKYRPWEGSNVPRWPGGPGQSWDLELGPPSMGWQWPGVGSLLPSLSFLSLSHSHSHSLIALYCRLLLMSAQA